MQSSIWNLLLSSDAHFHLNYMTFDSSGYLKTFGTYCVYGSVSRFSDNVTSKSQSRSISQRRFAGKELRTD
jgi:hypothetical protein